MVSNSNRSILSGSCRNWNKSGRSYTKNQRMKKHDVYTSINSKNQLKEDEYNIHSSAVYNDYSIQSGEDLVQIDSFNEERGPSV